MMTLESMLNVIKENWPSLRENIQLGVRFFSKSLKVALMDFSHSYSKRTQVFQSLHLWLLALWVYFMISPYLLKLLRSINQKLEINIKNVILDHGWKYYSKYDETCWTWSILQKTCNDVVLYRNFGTPEQLVAIERRNWTLIDMVKSMMRKCSLSPWPWVMLWK